MHFNIGKKIEVNPFDGINHVVMANTHGVDDLRSFLDKHSSSVETIKMNEGWRIAYAIDKLDFTTILQWIAPMRGKFYYKGKSIHFLLENGIMVCW